MMGNARRLKFLNNALRETNLVERNAVLTVLISYAMNSKLETIYLSLLKIENILNSRVTR